MVSSIEAVQEQTFDIIHPLSIDALLAFWIMQVTGANSVCLVCDDAGISPCVPVHHRVIWKQTYICTCTCTRSHCRETDLPKCIFFWTAGRRQSTQRESTQTQALGPYLEPPCCRATGLICTAVWLFSWCIVCLFLFLKYRWLACCALHPGFSFSSSG